MRKRISGLALLLILPAFSLIAGDFCVLAAQEQPAPPAPQTQTQPQTETPKKTTPSSKKKTRAKTPAKTTTATDTTTAAETTGDQTTTAPTQTTAPQTTRAMTMTEQPDLSGTYTGTFTCDELGLTGDTTLTITGNQFTTADGKTGRIVASKSGGYTAVALQVGEMATTPPTGAAAGTPATAPMIVSMRARKSGNRLMLTPAPGATMKCSFGPTRNVAKNRRHMRTPAATGTEVSNPAAPTTTPTTPTPTTTPTTPENPMPSQTPSPSPSPSPSGTPSPEPSPEPNPEPSPGGSPRPMPRPSPSGTPSPSPSASPSPSPSPRPRG
jgi:outer membrane biosynthesis protein TonB